MDKFTCRYNWNSSRLAVVASALLLALVAAACGGGDGGGQDGGAPPAGDADISVVGTDALEYSDESLMAQPGDISMQLTSESGIRHTIVVENADGDQLVVEAAAGQTASGSIELEAGTYTFYCDVPGHREAGMEGTLDVGQ